MLEVKLKEFNGPLDLLLDLIKSEKLDITRISLAKVADQYLAYMDNLKEIAASEVADFLLVAAKLLFIKSKVLLPKQEEEEDESDLLSQLRIYKQYLEASKNINKIIKKKNFLFSRAGGLKNEAVFAPPKEMNAEILNRYFQNFLARLEKEEVAIEQGSIARKISIHERIMEISDLLKKQKSFILNKLFTPFTRKEEKVVSFLAILELARREKISITQDELFSDITIDSFIN